MMGKIAHLLKGSEEAAPLAAPGAEEPCVSCGTETVAGSTFFSDRRETKMPDGTRVYLCSDCVARARRERRGADLSDEDIQTIAKNGGMIGAGFLGGMGGI